MAQGAGGIGTVRHARCHCGSLELACSGEPRKVSLCHCTDCQRRTGSAFSIAAFYPRADVTLVRGGAATYVRQSASGHAVSFRFCPDCGTSVSWEPDRMPHLAGVAVGCFADPDFPAPEQVVWDGHRCRWLELPAEIEVHRRNPVRPPARD